MNGTKWSLKICITDVMALWKIQSKTETPTQCIVKIHLLKLKSISNVGYQFKLCR